MTNVAFVSVSVCSLHEFATSVNTGDKAKIMPPLHFFFLCFFPFIPGDITVGGSHCRSR